MVSSAHLVNFSLVDFLGMSQEDFARKVKEAQAQSRALSEERAVELTKRVVAALAESPAQFRNGDEVQIKAAFLPEDFDRSSHARIFVVDTFEPVTSMRETTASRPGGSIYG